MKILLVVGRFPQLSETFIYRKVIAIAGRVDHVTVATRDLGDWNFFELEAPIPVNVSVRILTPDSRLFQPARIVRVVKSLIQICIQHPFATYRLLTLCRRNSSSVRETLRLFLRYIGFLDIQADVIHFEFAGLSVLYRLLPEILNTPYIVSCRGADLHLFPQMSLLQQEELRISLSRATAVHVVSSEMLEYVRKLSNRIESVWVNRPAVFINQIVQRATISGNETPLILATGRLVWKKGFDYLLAAMALLKKNGIHFRAQILGDGELRSSLQFSIFDLDLADCVELCGSVNPLQVLIHMQQADIFVLSSLEEGISNAVLEAMASGLPIVTTDAGGMAEAVRDGINGYVVPVRDIDALTNRLETLLNDHNLRQTMGEASRQIIEQEFSIDRQGVVFEEMYRTVSNTKVH